MLKGENIVCGTSSTGTGTITLVATPVAPGGVDFDVLARATGNGLANSAAILVPYTLIEYTSSAFATAKKLEKGWGLLTLAGSPGIASCTLVRTPQVTAINLDSQPATYNTNAPSAVSIGTAANVLVFIGPSAADMFTHLPHYVTSLGDNLGVFPYDGNAGGTSGGPPTSGTEYFRRFLWTVPMLAKKISCRIINAYTGGTPISNIYGRLYAVGADGLPSKLLIDFGLIGTSNASMNTASANISSASHANGFFMTPGEYYCSLLAIFSGGSSTPSWCANGNVIGSVSSGNLGSANFAKHLAISATSGNATAPDAANTTGLAGVTTLSLIPHFQLSP